MAGSEYQDTTGHNEHITGLIQLAVPSVTLNTSDIVGSATVTIVPSIADMKLASDMEKTRRAKPFNGIPVYLCSIFHGYLVMAVLMV